MGQGDQCAVRERGPKNVRRGVQTDAILLRFASADHGTKQMLAIVDSKVWPVSNFAQQLPTTRNNMQQCVQMTQNLTSQNFGSCWPKGLFTGLYRSINLTSFTALTKFKSLFLFQIFIGGFLETVSLSYITIVAMLKVKSLNSDVMILLPCSLPLGFTLWHFIKSRSQWNTKTGKLEAIRFGISAVFGAAGVSLLCYKYEVNKKTLLKILLSLLYKV